MRRDLRRFRHRRRNRLQMTIVFTVAVLGALALVAMRSCTDHLDGMYQDGGTTNQEALPTGQKLDQNRLEKLKKLLKEKGGLQKLLQEREGLN